MYYWINIEYKKKVFKGVKKGFLYFIFCIDFILLVLKNIYLFWMHWIDMNLVYFWNTWKKNLFIKK
jgi:hypothetical protein